MKQTLLFIDDDKGGLIQIANIKGGVGKSTMATNLAASFSRRGPTLLIDLDVQGSATAAFGHDPSENRRNSSELFTRRFYPRDFEDRNRFEAVVENAKMQVKRVLAPGLMNEDPITSLSVPVNPGLDLIPANADLYRCQDGSGLPHLMFNLAVCREYYKYVILDTPAVWNRMIQELYRASDITLIPVTLNALSTKSLRDYIQQLNRVTRKYPEVNFRIVKNEVFGSTASKAVGKAKTMMVNREFLHTIVKAIQIPAQKGSAYIPQSLVIDLEIPESSAIRSAQDQGMSIYDGSKRTPAQTVFNSLARQVQWILNEIPSESRRGLPYLSPKWVNLSRLAKVAVFLCVVIWSQKIISMQPPTTPALGHLEKASIQPIKFRFDGAGDNLYKVAKYAICQYRAIVPSYNDVNAYIREVLAYHNSRVDPAHRIADASQIPLNTELTFYPPVQIRNPSYESSVAGFRYFMGLVDDPYPYVTGLWADRGTGGGTPHAGVDVAARLGTKVISPVDGIAVSKDTQDGGRMVAVKFDNHVLFFAHLDKRFVKTGQKVQKGQPLGTIGMTGRTSGPHVHIGYGIKYPNRGVTFGSDSYRLTDPMLWFYRQNYMSQSEDGTLAMR